MNTNTSIFSTLGIADYYETNKALFNKQQIRVNENESVQRLKVILFIYQKWIEYNQNNPNASVTNIFEIIENELSPNSTYNVQGLLNDYRYCVDRNRNAFAMDESEENKQSEEMHLFCDVNTCFITDRNNRNKSEMTQMNHKRNELFFASNISGNESVKCIITQQILDTLHFWVFHTLKLDITKYLEYNESDNENESDRIDFDELCADTAIKKLTEILKNKMNSSKRFRANEGRYNSNNNKFVTKSMNESVDVTVTNRILETKETESNKQMAIYQSMVYGNEQPLLQQKKPNDKTELKTDNKSWMDDVLAMMNRYKIKNETIKDFYEYIAEEQFESEAVYSDVKNAQQSNILHTFEENYTFDKVLNICAFELDRDRNVYAQGFRYFYWNYYKDNENEWNVLYKNNSGQPVVEGNAGFRLKDWYIPNKYKDFKAEILYNALAEFSLSQYEDTLETATEKRMNWINDPHAPTLECPKKKGNWIERCYRIKAGDLIQIRHIMAVIFYCNYSQNSFVFSSTFRRDNIYETNELLKQRHSHFHFWAKYLRECIECFGKSLKKSLIPVFYHGVSSTMLFNSTHIHLHGPVSTTRDFIIAWSVFGSEGVVLDIKNTHGAAQFFDCNFWSSYTNEDEKLFFSGRSPLQFANIHNIPQRIHYKPLVKIITVFTKMFNGVPLFGIKPVKSDISTMSELIKNEINECYLTEPYHSKVPKYISFLFHQFIKQKTQIQINLRFMDSHFSHHENTKKCDVYGLKMFRSIFVSSNDETVQISVFIKLCRNVETITVYRLWSTREGFEASIKLDAAFVSELMTCIDTINKFSHSVVTRFEIVKPNGSINEFIATNTKIFADKKWKLKPIQYHHKKKNIGSEALLIAKM